MTQLSVSDIFGSVKDAERSNVKILEILDKHGTPETAEKTKEIAEEIAQMLSDMVLETDEINRKIGVNLEFVGDNPKISLFDAPSEGGCGGSCG
ncbi:MAG: hypothetical protein OIF32_09535 [Campylobacterales bacterium]|nr:hypothetical protein [Campylobacterales bacterium]